MTQRETVILIHGMVRSRAAMRILQARLRRRGYATVHFPYNPITTPLEIISAQLREHIAEKVDTPTYHVVAHSLGNIIVRYGWKMGYPSGMGRMVMLAPPNHPLVLPRILKDKWLYKLLTGDCGQKLSDQKFYRSLPHPQCEFGIIAGDIPFPLRYREPSDGLVPLRLTKLKGMKDWIALHHMHNLIMSHRDTYQQILHFLEHGTFYRPQEIS